jgi:hypothetical protein
MDSTARGIVDFASWDDVRAELAQFGSAELLERAKRDLHAYLDANRPTPPRSPADSRVPVDHGDDPARTV